MILSILDIFAFSFILEPLVYLIIPSYRDRLSQAGKIFQIIGVVSFVISIIFLIKSLLSSDYSSFLFFVFFGISYVAGLVCLNLDLERDKDEK